MALFYSYIGIVVAVKWPYLCNVIKKVTLLV